MAKVLVVANVPPGREYEVVPGLVWITNLNNSGAAFGLAPAGAGLFLAASAGVALALLWYVARNPGPALVEAMLGLILGGTLGNGYDRVFHGTVTDFVALHWWPVFNVADSAISVGVAVLVAGYLLRKASG